ncbi:hypothetical protein GGTG_01302 [Gaeumannomyces tritici R3-111a-1]|uniref:Zinc finger PHD-type domain-containing protein n=1 Tax=Gaeumannomyces tritici (strain R3-111a-1) TaxID=644352 RepID=J3NJ68_GAET3|nr:hypothetical protein GGTG_01302 [Gaeumannomyces tritici R3-111a-1]EJT81319.1 hypothetical protein GGTG_01302 [Gaeumannomyces tritici R3-111a-1]
MRSSRKRAIDEVDGDDSLNHKEPSLLQRIRDMWQLANVVQFLTIFGSALKIDAPDINELEAECLKPFSLALQELGLGMLKFLSSHRGLTHDIFDEYTRRQFAAKAPGIENPFGTEDALLKFADFDVFQKIRVLHQMTQLILRSPEKLRERMMELKEADHDHTAWRVEPVGWDEDENTYFLLDDNRLYKLTEAPPPTPAAPKPKKNSKKARAMARAAKRRRISEAVDSGTEGPDDDAQTENDAPEETAKDILLDDGLGGAKWECICVTLDDVRRFLAPLQKTRDGNEKVLRDTLLEHLVPTLEREEEKRIKKQKERERELMTLEKMANAKRSSRLAHKAERQKVDEQAETEVRKRLAEEAAARKQQELERKREKDRSSRLMSREKRLREREARRLQHEEELAHLSEDSRSVGSGAGRMSDRRREAEIQRAKKALKELEDEEDEWVFDCVCGLHGQVDDGEHSVSCERCNVWQHSKCLGIDQKEAESDDFHFICVHCRKLQEGKQRPRGHATVIKLKLGSASSSPETPKAAPPSKDGARAASGPTIELSSKPGGGAAATEKTPKMGDISMVPNSSPVLPPPPEQLSFTIPIKSAGPAPAPHNRPGSSGLSKAVLNGTHNPFSSPHPDLSPPSLSPNKARAYNTVFEQSSPTAALGGQNGHQAKANGRVRISTTPILPPVLPRVELSSVRLSSPSKQQPGSRAPSRGTSPKATPGANKTSLVTTPQLKAGYPEPLSAHKASPLPPSSAGVSPTKHSPSLHPATVHVILPNSSPAPPVLPPIAALSPSPRPLDLTPPVKPSTPGSSFSNGIN